MKSDDKLHFTHLGLLRVVVRPHTHSFYHAAVCRREWHLSMRSQKLPGVMSRSRAHFTEVAFVYSAKRRFDEAFKGDEAFRQTRAADDESYFKAAS